VRIRLIRSIRGLFRRAALLTKNIRDLRDPSTAAQIATQMSEADAGGTLFTTIHRRSDGSTFPVEVSSIGADIGGEHLLLSVIRDNGEPFFCGAPRHRDAPSLCGC